MSIAEDMKSITENIIVSYNQRIKDVGAIVNDTKATLKRLEVEHCEMAAKLKKDLKDFNAERVEKSVELKDELVKAIKENATTVSSLLGEYRADMNKASEAWSSMTVALAKAREKGFVPSVEVGEKSISHGKKKSKKKSISY